MTIGAWINFDELEESLTLNELFTLYSEVQSAELRMFKNMARAQGADIPFEEDYGAPEPVQKDGTVVDDAVLDRLLNASGDDPFKSILSRIDEDAGEATEGQTYRKMKMGYKKL